MDASSAATEMLPATIQWHHGDIATSKSWDHALATNHLPSPSRLAGSSEHNKRPRLFPKRGKSDDFIYLLETSHHHHLYNRPEKKQSLFFLANQAAKCHKSNVSHGTVSQSLRLGGKGTAAIRSTMTRDRGIDSILDPKNFKWRRLIPLCPIESQPERLYQ